MVAVSLKKTALLATAASQLLLSDSSVAVGQRAGRLGHLERRFELPITAVMTTEVHTVPPDATIEEFLSVHLVGQRRRSVPVVDDANRYLGMAVLDEVVAIRREAWATTDVRTIARTTAPRGRTTWLVRDAVTAAQALEWGLVNRVITGMSASTSASGPCLSSPAG